MNKKDVMKIIMMTDDDDTVIIKIIAEKHYKINTGPIRKVHLVQSANFTKSQNFKFQTFKCLIHSTNGVPVSLAEPVEHGLNAGNKCRIEQTQAAPGRKRQLPVSGSAVDWRSLFAGRRA